MLGRGESGGKGKGVNGIANLKYVDDDTCLTTAVSPLLELGTTVFCFFFPFFFFPFFFFVLWRCWCGFRVSREKETLSGCLRWWGGTRRDGTTVYGAGTFQVWIGIALSSSQYMEGGKGVASCMEKKQIISVISSRSHLIWQGYASNSRKAALETWMVGFERSWRIGERLIHPPSKYPKYQVQSSDLGVLNHYGDVCTDRRVTAVTRLPSLDG